MTIPSDPSPPGGSTAGTVPLPPRQHAWLEEQVAAWQATGLIGPGQAGAIRARYTESRRLTLSRIMLMVGGGFLAVGLVWLVASNYDEISPLVRFALVTLAWLGFVAGAEALATRRTHDAEEGSPTASPVVGALRLLAAAGFGAVVFQAAQSLQVPAYEPALVGWWGVGALLYAYAVGGVAPLLVAVATTTVWFTWQVAEGNENGMGFVLPVLLAAVAAGAVAALHAARWRPAFAAGWREASAVLALLALFVAAFPLVDAAGFTWSAAVVAGTVAALAMAAAALALTRGQLRVEAAVPLLALVAGVLLVLWEPPQPVEGLVAGEGYVHAFVSVTTYLAAAGWYAALGVLRDSPRLTWTATGALVLFTTVQSFAVFAPIITGATLFLLLGAVLMGTGYVVDRGRRRLVANLEGATA